MNMVMTLLDSYGDDFDALAYAALELGESYCKAKDRDALDELMEASIKLKAATRAVQALSKLLTERRSSLILPIVVGKHTSPIPMRIDHVFRLDFTKRSRYASNVKQLVNRISGVDKSYSGSRWYKGLNISNFGLPVGVGPTAQRPSLGASYCISWEHGTVVRVDVYESNNLVHYKQFDYDAQGRVVANRMYSPDGNGGWAILDDVWYYEYSAANGSRSTKTMRFLGEATARVVSYDAAGRAIAEVVVTDPGRKPDRAFSYARKVFQYDADGNALGERWFDAAGHEIHPVA